MNKAEINMKLPSLNEYIAVCRKNQYEAAKFKRDIEDQICLFINRLPEFHSPVTIQFTWYEKDLRRDADNIAAGKKFILDALVKAGKLPNDSRRWVVGFTDEFITAKETKVVIYVKELNEW